jgi:adenylate kinase family enzyme
MKSCRIHIMGASGAGVTSLGRALADAIAIPHHARLVAEIRAAV